MTTDTGFGPMDGDTPAPKKPRHILLTPELLQRAFENHRRYLKLKKLWADRNGTTVNGFTVEYIDQYLDTLPDVQE